MASSDESRDRLRRRLRIFVSVLIVLVFILVVPPLVSVSRYKSQITSLMARSLGRPVRLSSVEVRLLPWPGFVLSDLSVAEDPAYGAEPVLHASKVTASIRLLALWSGRLEIGEISVDEASLNIVRAGPGQWNLDSLFHTAAAQTGAPSGSTSRRPAPLPYLQATNSRIDFKDGVEKLPFSIVNADLSVSQQDPGEWRIRLRGQPARTDLSLFQEDTGVVRLDATVRRAPDLHDMPVHLDLDWRQAQLGQLARLLTGSDPGWRGDLTGELHLDGTANAATIATRLRAVGVHRDELAPVAVFDFDANCRFNYSYSVRSLQNLACDSPLGDGRIRLTGDKLGRAAPPRFSVELDRIPVAAGLDVLRTLRGSIEPGLQAVGDITGKLAYAAPVPSSSAIPAGAPGPSHLRTGDSTNPNSTPQNRHQARPGAREPVANPLTGSLTVENLVLSSGGLTQPLQVPKLTLQPVAAPQGSPQAIAGTVAIPSGGAVPLAFNLRFALSGYQVGVHGQASFARARQLAHAAGIPQTAALESLAGDPVAVDVTAEGPWIPAEETPLIHLSKAQAASPAAAATVALAADSLTGTVAIRSANLKADYLANHVQISDATLHIDNGSLRWDPVAFSYGPLKGTASLTLPSNCPDQVPPEPCPAQFQMHFADLDAAAVQTALLGATVKGTLLSDLIDRIHPSSAPPWPQLQGAITADSLVLGPVTLQTVSASLKVAPTGAEITSLDAGLLGGKVHATASLDKPANDRDKPYYSFEGQFENLSAPGVGELLDLRSTGSSFNANGKIELSGYSAADLAASAKGTLHFEWRNGTIGKQLSASTKAVPVPAALARFDRFTADAAIADGAMTLNQTEVVSGARKKAVQATVTFGVPPKLTFPAPKTTPKKP